MKVILLLILSALAHGHPFSPGANTTENDFVPQPRQSSQCNYQYTFTNVGEFVYLNSESYPNNYPPNLNCQYTINAPAMTRIALECAEFNVEASANCQYDRLFWSLSGDPFFRDIRYICGQGQVNQVISNENKLTIGFKSDGSNPQSSSVYRYRCKLSTVPTQCSCGVGGGVNNYNSDGAGSQNNESLLGLSPRIVNGNEAGVAELPWNVLLYTQNNGPFCGATLISPSWLLTAAHCTQNVAPGETLFADIGDHDYTTPDEAKNQVIAVDRIIQNSMYSTRTQDSDTSLLHLSQPVTYSRNIQPICLPWKFTSMNVDGVKATASGWGTTYFGGPLSTKLRRVDLDCKSTPTCQSTYSGTTVTITENMICASRPGKDTCQSDSGGPLQYYDPPTGQWYQLGVVSFGEGCANSNKPGVYAFVAKFLGWIEQNTGERFCKA